MNQYLKVDFNEVRSSDSKVLLGKELTSDEEVNAFHEDQEARYKKAKKEKIDNGVGND